ncbi:M20 family metallopeptidase [Ornithinibacillus sp. 4-3]|uniref:M20 family metallopeptidase n=1 Tax=Ornithinibacillus sp. 4-3 TaxID=3231488 RepID=A0AB39HLS0_9BACI
MIVISTNDSQVFLNANIDQIKKDLLKLVQAESPSKDIEKLNQCREVIQQMMKEKFNDLFKVTTYTDEEYGTHLLYELNESNQKARILFLSHYDTVWNVGDLEIKEDGNKIYGPGIFDMKSGLLSSVWAIATLLEEGELPIEPVFLFTSDEELGSATSRPLIEEVAQTCDAAFILEPPQATTNALKTERKGVGRYTVIAHGKSAHAGNHHEDGVNAINEIARIVTKVADLTDYAVGTTVNVGQITGGTKTNVVPEKAQIEIDFRVKTQTEADRIQAFMNALVPEDKHIKLEIEGGLNRPPLEKTPENEKLFKLAETAAEKLGIEISASAVGGGSDGNFTSAIGVPTLDGLGIPGDGAHARIEHILFDQFVDRCALVAEVCKAFAAKNN